MSSASETPQRKRKQPHSYQPPAPSPSVDSTPSAPATRIRNFTAECALSLEGTLFGGQALGVAGSHVRTVIRSVKARDVDPWMGITIEFPFGPSAEDDGFGLVYSRESRSSPL